LHGHDCDGKPLQFAARQLVDLPLEEIGKVEVNHKLFRVVLLVLLLDDVHQLALHEPWDAVDVLRLDRSAKTLKFCEDYLQYVSLSSRSLV